MIIFVKATVRLGFISTGMKNNMQAVLTRLIESAAKGYDTIVTLIQLLTGKCLISISGCFRSCIHDTRHPTTRVLGLAVAQPLVRVLAQAKWKGILLTIFDPATKIRVKFKLKIVELVLS